MSSWVDVLGARGEPHTSLHKPLAVINIREELLTRVLRSCQCFDQHDSSNTVRPPNKHHTSYRAQVSKSGTGSGQAKRGWIAIAIAKCSRSRQAAAFCPHQRDLPLLGHWQIWSLSSLLW